MSNAVITITIFANLILPFLLLRWVAFNKGKSKFYSYSIAFFVLMYFIMLYLGGAAWSWFGNWWSILFLVLYAPAFIKLFRDTKTLPLLPVKKFKPLFAIGVFSGIGVLFAISNFELLSVRSFDGTPVNLNFPLKNGTYHIGHGGSSEVVNAHFPIPGQKYALDILKVNGMGIRAKGLLPEDLAAYYIYEDIVYSPCIGEVLTAQDGFDDNIPPKMDREHLAGNHVIIFCKGHSILLAHLKKSSLQVQEGDQVTTGTIIGKVGNSGNTSEPHLHIHTVKGKHSETNFINTEAEGVPMIFQDRFLVRNDTF